MSTQLHWPTFILALIGAFGGLAWIPSVVKLCQCGRIVGKVISRYGNLNVDKTQTLFLFKLSILSKNKPFNLMQIKCEIEDVNGIKFLASAENNRLIIFTFEEGKPQKLLASGDEFLNNSSLLPANQNVVGYLFYRFNGNLNGRIRSTTFIFESFENKIRKLKFKESDMHGEQLFFDDTIWQMVDRKEIENHPAIRHSTEEKVNTK